MNGSGEVAIRATWMRGGTSKGVFFAADDLPRGLMQRPSARDALLLRVVGSPDPHGQQIDGLGGATASTSKVVIVSKSLREDCDVEFLYGAVAIDAPTIDWSGRCGDLASAVGPFAIARGWVGAPEADHVASTVVRIRQQNLGKRIVAHVPTRAGRVVESGAFQEDGVPFAASEIRLEFLDPGDDEAGALLPTGRATDVLAVPELADQLPASAGLAPGAIRATLMQLGEPVVFVRADALKLTAREGADALHRDAKALARLEAVRARAAVAMKLARNVDEASRNRASLPRIAFVAAPAAYRSSAGIDVDKGGIDVLARLVSAGRLHPSFTDAGSTALAVAAALPGTVVSEVARTLPGVPTRIGHPSGVLAVGAVVESVDGRWAVDRTLASRSARRLMDGMVFVPASPDR